MVKKNKIHPSARIGEARINSSRTVYSALVLSEFNEDGTYNKTDWEDKQLISEQLMDKIENAIYKNTNDILNKFDNVTVEQSGATNTLTFYANGNVVKEITLTSVVPEAGTLETSQLDYSVISEKDTVIIPYVFQTENRGNATLFIDIVVGETNKTLEYTLTKVGAGSVNIGTLTKGINYLTMYVIDAVGKQTNTVSFTIVSGALDIISTFDDGKDYEMYNAITIPFTISALDKNDTMILNVNIDGTLFTQQVYDGYNIFTYPSELRTIGVHSVTMQVIGTAFQSNILEYNIVVANSSSILLSSKSTEWKTEEGYKVEVSYRISMIGQTMFNVNYYINDELYSTVEGSSGTNTFVGDYRDFTLGDYSLKIEVSTVDGNITSVLPLTIKIVENSFKRIEAVKIGLQAYFNMATKSNGDADRDVLYSEVTTDNDKRAKLVLHDYNYATNGWIDGRLVSNGKAWAEIEDYLPLEDNAINGFTFDILFSSNNIGDNEARVVDCVGVDIPYTGFYIDSEKALIRTDSNTLTSYYTDKTDMRVTFVINRTSTFYEEYIKDENGYSVLNPNPTYKPNPMVQTYIDGIFTDVAMLSDTGNGNDKIYENIMNNQNILINTDKAKELFGNNTIKSIRIYNRPLEHEEVLQNYMADYDDLMEQKAIYEKNYVTVDQDIPTLYFYDTPIGKHDIMTKDTKQWINIVYTSPNTEKYGQSFDLMGQTSWQGTSSLQYPIKNYKFKLYDWARDDNGDIIEDTKWDKDTYTKKKVNMYPSSGDGFTENTFCLKADYMDSSHCRNTGTARLVDELLFDGYLNPAQKLDSRCRSTINGFPCNLYINGRWFGVYNFNHDKSCTKSLGVEQIDGTVRWEIKANSDTSAGAFIKTWKTIEECYDAINTDFEIVYDEDAFNDKTGSYDVTRYYDELGFSHKGKVIGTFYDYAILSMARLVNFVSSADEKTWQENVHNYIDVEQACRYYLNVMTMGMIDNFAKNCIVQMYGDDIWYFHFYDMDSSLGLDNTGYKKFDSNIEPSQEGIYNCSTSRMWTKLNDYSQDDLFNTFKKLREGKYTYENICKYLIQDQIDIIPQILYNKDMYSKYISQGRTYLHMLHGNNKDHLKRWLYNRFQYVDSLFLQHNSPYTKKSITIRSCKPSDAVPKYDNEGNIISQYVARFEIQTYTPQYVTICWRKNTYETKRVNWGETVVFERDMVNSQDNELIIYCAGNLKYIGDASGLNPTSVDIGNADRLLEFICEDSDKLVKADLSKNVYLRKASFNNCSILGTASGGSNVIDISECTNLKDIDLRGTQITSVLTNISGGNLETILYPTSIQNVIMSNQINLKVLGLPHGDNIAPNLTNVQILDCNNIETLKYPYDEANPTIDFESIKYVQNLTLDNSLQLSTINFKGFNKLKNLVIRNMANMSNIGFDDMLDKDDTATLEKITLINIPLIQALTFNVSNEDNAIKFVNGAVIDVGGLTSLSSIESNYAIQGLDKLIMPTTVQRLIFKKEFGEGDCSVTKVYSGSANSTETENCINVLDCKIRQLMLENLANKDVKNLYYAPITDEDKIVTVPYIFNATGTMDICEFVDTVEDLFNGLDIANKIEVVNSKNITMPHTDLYRLFKGAILDNATVNKIMKWFKNVTSYKELLIDNTYVTELDIDSWDTSKVRNWNGAFKNCINLTTSPTISDVAEDISNILYNCNKITNITIPLTVSTYDNALYGCTNITDINWTKERATDFSLITLGCPSYTEEDVRELVPEHLVEVEDATLTLDETYGAYLTLDEIFIANRKGWTIVGASNDFTIINASDDVSGYTTDENVTSCFIELTSSNYTTRINEVLKWYPNCTDLYLFDDGSVTNLSNMLSSSTYKSQIINVTFMDEYFGNLTNMESTFSGCTKLTQAPTIPNGVTNMRNTFRECSSLTTAPTIPQGVTNITYTFYGCTSLTTSPSIPNRVTDMSGIFYGCTSLTQAPTIPQGVTSMGSAFNGCSKLTTAPTIPNSVTDMGSTFQNCKALTKAPNIPNSVTKLSYAFYGCTALQEDIVFPTCATDVSYCFQNSGVTSIHSNWNTTYDGTITTTNCYSGCGKITSIDGEYGKLTFIPTAWGGLGFTKDATTIFTIDTTKTDNLTFTLNSHTNCTGVDWGDGTIDTTYGSHTYAEHGVYEITYKGKLACGNARYVQPIENIIRVDQVSQSTELDRLVDGCINLEYLDLSNFAGKSFSNIYLRRTFNDCKKLKTIVGLDSFYVNLLYEGSGSGSVFYNCSSLEGELDLSKWTIKKYKSSASNVSTSAMFSNCSKITKVKLNFGVWSTTDSVDMSSMFSNCTALTDVEFTGTIRPNNVLNMFNGCTNITSDKIKSLIDIMDLSQITSNKNAKICGYQEMPLFLYVREKANITNANELFYNNTSLTTLDGLGMENWDSSKITSMYYMFDGCSSLTDISAISGWNVSSVTNMSYMFYNCSKLTDISALSNWDTSNVTNMNYMFNGCNKVADWTPIQNWNVSSVTSMSSMFYAISSTASKVIDLSNWNTSNVTSMSNMFYISYFTDINMSGCDVSKVTNFGTVGYSNLTNFNAPKNISADFKLYSSAKLTYTSLMSIINNLATVSTTKTLTLGTTNLNKLSDADKAIATNKGWTLK